MTAKMLIVDDERAICETLEAVLRRRGLRTMWNSSAADALRVIEAGSFKIVVTDFHMHEIAKIEIAERVAQNDARAAVVVLTSFGSLDVAVEAIRATSRDAMSKPVDVDMLSIAIERAAGYRPMELELRRLRLEVAQRSRIRRLPADLGSMQRVNELVSRLQTSEATVLIVGESGTGKEVIARAIHAQSRRKDGPFVAINCAAMPEHLLESELFGHMRGAFTDARDQHPGLFVQAKGGTLFLDEIGDMALSLQPKLLRALQERTVRPLGSKSEIPVDVRIIAATNRDLESAIAHKLFREDLFYRINVVQIALPPLRARSNDILSLALEFTVRYALAAGKVVTGFSKEVAERLTSYPWPGNVRELQNCIERAVTLTRQRELSLDDLPEKIRSRAIAKAPSTDSAELAPLAEIERRYIFQVIDAVAGNKTAAARLLGVERRTLYRKLERYAELSATAIPDSPPIAADVPATPTDADGEV